MGVGENSKLYGVSSLVDDTLAVVNLVLDDLSRPAGKSLKPLLELIILVGIPPAGSPATTLFGYPSVLLFNKTPAETRYYYTEFFN
jgi:hypothetical protein